MEIHREPLTIIFITVFQGIQIGLLWYCHDLKEILWVPNFLLYLSNMLTTVVVKELRFC